MKHPIQFLSIHDLISNAPLILSQDSVHIWHFSEDDLPYFSKQGSILSAEEQKTWSSYKHIETKNCFLIGHTSLRLILGRYLNTSPESLTFRKNQHGKLYLETKDLAGNVEIQFNITHSGGHVLIAFCRFSEIGIDLEQVYIHRQIFSIVKRFYHPDERIEFQDVPEDEKGTWFYRRWTAREAFLKAIGTGLTIDPESFYVEISSLPHSSDYYTNYFIPCSDNTIPQNPISGHSDIRCFQIKKSQEDYSSWQIYTFSLFSDYIVSVCFS